MRRAGGSNGARAAPLRPSGSAQADGAHRLELPPVQRQEKKKAWNPALQEQVTKDWNQLFADIEASLGEDPASPKAQELAARWKSLLSGFTGGDPEIQKGLNSMYADRDNWPAEQRERYSIKPELWAFIQKAFAAAPKQ